MEIKNNINLNYIALSVLKAILPSLSHSDISGVRLARPKLPTLNSPDHVTKFPSFIVTLKNKNLVQLIMRAKKSMNYLNTKNFELTSLNPEVASALPDRKIFVNEVLSSLDQVRYIMIKEAAKNLGFKFVWHCAGRFLVRWEDRMRSHVVRSVSDLHTIIQTLGLNNTAQHNTPGPRPIHEITTIKIDN